MTLILLFILCLQSISSGTIVQLSPATGFSQAKAFLNCYINSTAVELEGFLPNFNSSLDKSVAQSILNDKSFSQENFLSYLARTNFSDSASQTGSTQADKLFLKFIGLAVTKTSGDTNITSISFDGPIPISSAYSSTASTQTSAKPIDKVVFLEQLNDVIPDNALKYGDGILLQHKNYGIYITADGGVLNGHQGFSNNTMPGGITGNPTNKNKFYIQTGTQKERWGDNFNGKAVLSGHCIRLEFYAPDNTAVGFDKRFWFAFNDWKTWAEGSAVVASVSAAYARYNALFGSRTSMIIYKYKGTYNSSTIQKGDTVYLFHAPQAWWDGTPAFLGSHNKSVDGFKEVFWYRSYTKPPTFDTEYLWVVEDVYPGAYKTAPAAADTETNRMNNTDGGGIFQWNAMMNRSDFQF